MALTVDRITADDWSIQDAKLKVFDIAKENRQLSLLSAALTLPPPFSDFTVLDVHCKKFQWLDNFLACQQGQGRIESAALNSPSFEFSFQVQDQQGTITIRQLRLFGGKVAVDAREKAGKWRIKIKAKSVSLARLKRFFALQLVESVKGRVDFELEVEGAEGNVKELLASALLKKLTFQVNQGKLASEELMFRSDLAAEKKNTGWQWRSRNKLLNGGLYIDPIYLEVQGKQIISLDVKGFWWQKQKKISVAEAKLNHLHVGQLQGTAKIDHRTDIKIESADLSASIPQLQTAAPVYLAPFLESGLFEGIELAGGLDARMTVKQNIIKDLAAGFKNLMLNDVEQRFYLNQANGQLNWTRQHENSRPSFIDWQQLRVKAIPFNQGRLDFVSYGKQFKLLKQADLAVLGGVLSINNFNFTAGKGGDPDVQFDGAVRKLSLAQLSEALNWQPLSGELNGYIPSVRYQNKKLELDGELKMQLFDGEIRITKLASSGLFTDFARFYTDIEIDNLDLNTLTRKFQVGHIEGRLSGFARNVYLENWQPISFYAWLGTPEDDDSRHRISQKAVENIASIGGGGAADAISRGFLGLFDTFGYDQLGFGCYLHQGVCQMMGVEAAENGYYLIKGGGLPRIDVIGYNSRLDWGVLIRRLKRITASKDVVVQ